MKFLITFLFNACVVPVAAAQDKFGSGFYVTNTDDTVRGFIQYKSTYSDGFIFRSQVRSASEKFSATKAKSFGFTSGSIYERIEYSEKKDIPSATVFVSVLIEGEIDLFGYQQRYLIGSDQKGRFLLAKGKTTDQEQALKNYQLNSTLSDIGN